MFVPNHLHLIVKCYVNNPPKSESVLNDWFIRLVEKVRMVVVAGPTSVYVNEPGNEGLTGTVTLATSHASIHVWDNIKPALVQFDIYSCTCFTPDEVLNHLDEFDVESAEYLWIDRNDSIKVTDHKVLEYSK